MKKANGSLMRYEYCCVEVERSRLTDKAVRGDGTGLEVGEVRCEVERDEKEVDGIGHDEGDGVDDLEVQLD